MKNALLAVSDGYQEVNIGDSIQALAASQFLENSSLFIQRESLNSYSGERCNMIMNGWYMDHPENWPPSPKINPLYVALHINHKTRDLMLTDKSIEYFKRHEPIGCRDRRTERLLKERGVDAYFSGCLTLTFGEKYLSKKRSGVCYIVDVPVWRILSVREKGSLIFSLVYNFRPILKLYNKRAYVALGAKSFIERVMHIALFYMDYTQFFTKDILLNAEYIAHTIERGDKSDEQLLNISEELVKKYSQAVLVITNRIHCALPCLGLETPVIYINDVKQNHISSCRFDGLLELFNIIDWDSHGRGLYEKHFNVDGKIDIHNAPKNKGSYKRLKRSLISRCRRFVNSIK